MAKQLIPGASRGTVFHVTSDRVTIIGRDTNHKAGDHPLFQERALRPFDEARVRNIRVYGVKVAVVVRKNGTHTKGPYNGQDILEVIDGRGRTIDCREAARRALEAGEVAPMLKVEFERSDEDTQIGVMVSLNEHRDDDTPLARAKNAARVLAMGRPIEDVANMFRVTTQAVRQWQKLLELAKPVQKAVERGEIAASAAVQLGELAHDEQTAKLSELIAEAPVGKRPTATQTRARANGEEQPLRLTAAVARKIAKNDTWMQGLSSDARNIIEAFGGDAAAIRRVPGLTRLLTQKKETARKPKSTRAHGG